MKDDLRAVIRELLQAGPLYATSAVARGNVRGDTTVRSNDGHPLEDDSMADVHSRAACCLVRDDKGLFLAVSRKHDPSAMGLPGGSVEAGEEPEAAARRELFEETGLTAGKLTQVFDRVNDDGFHVFTFACSVSGKVKTNEAGIVRWVKAEELLLGPFSDYNAALFDALGIRS